MNIRPTRQIAEQALTGPATVIISGIAEGMKSTWLPLLTTVVAIIVAFFCRRRSGRAFCMGLYGVGIAAVGMLVTLGITLATDAYGPIADNAGGNAEMTGQEPHVRERTDMLDSLGNTTAATGKGFAIGSAALTAMALLAAYVQVVQTQLTTQAERFAGEQAAGVTTPSAIYEGHGVFAVVFPNAGPNGTVYADGAMFTQTHEISRAQYRALQSGVPIPVRAVGDNPVSAFRYEVAAQGDRPAFVLTSTRQGSIRDVLDFYNVTLTNPRVLGGLFVGVMLTFLFCALTMNAVGRAAYRMMNECRRQFGKMREAFRQQGMSEDAIADPQQWPKRVNFEGVDYPDYANCVSISTAGAQREMIFPSMLAIIVPVGLGLLLGPAGVMGMLAGGLVSGFAVAVFMANAGGAWDNAKKLLESYGRITAEDFQNNKVTRDAVPVEVRQAIADRAAEAIRTGKPQTLVYGKGSSDHKATVVGDTVGDPFKDTSGPSLNILIKLISIVSVVFAGLVVRYGSYIGSMLGLE